MEVSEKLVKPVIETKYLTMENADRYRPIIRLFYLHYEKLKYWMYPEEVYEELKKSSYFLEYTMEQCQQDLAALTGWGNLMAIQDTRKVTTIEEFKNKKFRYQLSEYAVEIERMVIRLENLFIEGASLEPTLLERIRLSIMKLESIGKEDAEAVYSWWNDLNNDFIRLNQNYQDYMRELNSVKAEELMKTREFLVFKDRLVEYLRSFVKSLQRNSAMIEQLLKDAREETVSHMLQKVLEYELSIPRLDLEVSKEQLMDRLKGRFLNIRNWFLGTGEGDSEAGKIFDTTNEIIRKITRYAARISEFNSSGANRREEYHKLAVLFGRCGDIKEAHKLSALVFGIEKPVHLKGEFNRATESINSGVYEEEPEVRTVMPRVRSYREKAKRSGIPDRTEQKEAMREMALKQLKEQGLLLKSYIKEDRLDFSRLPVLKPQVRDVFLTWLSRALERKDLCSKTEDGRSYRVAAPENGETCVLECVDGSFHMPAYVIFFED